MTNMPMRANPLAFDNLEISLFQSIKNVKITNTIKPVATPVFLIAYACPMTPAPRIEFAILKNAPFIPDLPAKVAINDATSKFDWGSDESVW
ncbi:unnamed protein product [[Candida] boidinii]|nr:unnamed protein product [[Candida] boidinii]